MRQPTKPKPQAFEEVARVLNVYDMLNDELRARHKGEAPIDGVTPDTALTASIAARSAILAVAERIAARTEG